MMCAISKTIKLVGEKPSKKIQQVCDEIISTLAGGRSEMGAQEKREITYDIIVCIILTILAPRQVEGETLLRKTWTRHALINEVA
jgi:hypothetical protein